MGVDIMIKINNNYYAKNTIKKVTEIIRTEENCVHYYQFSVYIELGDKILIEETIKAQNDSSNALRQITALFNQLLDKL
jgi:hypothetical protein